MADDIEVEITIPDDEGEEESESNSAEFEAGIASEKADNAEEQAEIAEITADTALDMASYSASEIAEMRTQIELNLQTMGTQSVQILDLQTQIESLVTITNNLAAIAVADLEKEEFEEMPPDETPPNRHWLMRPIFGGK